ncbi:flagellar biosynthetic protein FliO [Alicyclobacillus cycloheptanicus]|uniref:Flagellar protein FliO/FliZ n=1 Tax=Alicyclobacillus cycloheptanicus TaxID=1457 RepID=A0ABT9XLE4_9BACL|nr:flagellar biosynthetic protein FliO [Alicyclobacillus cycloheptanicus]MDQ0190546.1 flagellar protein FliO/FliZ [Alicyclobacillus cycloheptanicus]WDM01388.1 flagellar biosynthetic protein FliO [Alicyclobacillus cycloheptanicus]
MYRFSYGLLGLVGMLAVTPTVYAATPSNATSVAPLGNPVPAIIQLVLALILVIGGILFMIRWLARRAGVQTRGAIDVVAARQLAPNRSVQVIDVNGKRYLVGVGDQISLLADVTELFPEDDGEAMAGPVGSSAFAQVLADKVAAVRKRYQHKDGADS